MLKSQQVKGCAVLNKRFETFTLLINRISRSIRKIENQEMAEYNLRGNHISCLYYLYLSDGITATDLCERCEEDKATVSRSLDYLENGGYLVCESKKTKRYKSPLRLTEKGKEIGKKISDKIAYFLGEISTELTEEERLQFYHCLTSISKGLDSIANKECN